MKESTNQPIRALGLTDTTMLVMGTVIGTGVFMKTSVMMQQVETPALVLAAWIAAGLLSLAGALTYAELGASLPEAGGEYVYLRAAYGEAPAFLFGWTRFAVAAPGSIAILGVGFATFLSAILPLHSVWAAHSFQVFGREIHWQFGLVQVVAVSAILFFSAINCIGVAFGGRVQSFLTVAKLLGIGVIVGGVFFFSRSATWENLAPSPGAAPWSGFKAFGAAMLAALWAYDGWNNMPMVAGEIRNPGRNIPRALILRDGGRDGGLLRGQPGILLCIAGNRGHDLKLHRLPERLPVATKAAQTFLGSTGGKLVSIAFMLSAIGALNGSILSNARVSFAMARDGLFFSRFGRLSEGARVPVWSIVIQAAVASVLAISGSFDQLTDYVLFASWIFYGLTTSAVFVLRRRRPDLPRPYRTFGYPLVPLVFVLVAVWLVINTLQTSPVESAVGLILLTLGLPFYFYYRRTTGTANARSGALIGK